MKFLGSISLLSVAALLAGCLSPQEPSNVTVYYNADIITMDPAAPTADTLVVEGNTILAVGKAADFASRYTGANALDMKGQTILPGIIDSHVHIRELGMDKLKADLVGVKNIDDIVERMTARYPNPEAGVWLIGQGWDEGYFASVGNPDRAKLDAAFPNNPVALESLHGFGGFYNGAALKIANIDENSPEALNGKILRRENGEPTGVMLVSAQELVNTHIPPISNAQIEDAIVAGLETMMKQGVTSVHEAGMTGQDVEAFQNLAKHKKLPIRVYGLLNGNDKALMDGWFTRGILDDPKDWLDIRSIKVYYDGSLGSRTALMREPYSDVPDAASPAERITPQRVGELGADAAKHKFQMAVHAIGDEGNDRVLNAYETALAPYPGQDHRWRVEHAQVVLPDYYGRVAKLGVLSSVESSHAVGDSAWAEDRVGPERIKHAYAWQRILGAGGRLMMNSDLPGEPWTPMETLYFSVTRQRLDGTPKGGWYADQALSTEEALKAMTIENAYGAFQEDKLGSLTPGKWADFITLNQNPLETAPANLKDIKVTGTWVAGKKLN
ncbi:MAG: amidohydrolase [Alphaproteobacteria bacterium]